MRALDLFAGTGWGVACERLGIREDGVDNMREVQLTRRMAGLHTPWSDIRDVPLRVAGAYDLLIASPPCQSYSIAGLGAGRKALDDVMLGIDALKRGLEPVRTTTDDRTWLVLEPLRFALAGRPQYIAWEQVPNVQPVWDVCASTLAEVGYTTWTGIIHAEQFGVPQSRRRAILLARNDGVATLAPTPTHSRFHPHNPTLLDPGLKKWVSMAEALGWDEQDAPRTLRSNYGTNGNARDRGERPDYLPAPTVTSKINRNLWMARNAGPGAQRNPRSIDVPSYTVRANGSGSHPSGLEWRDGLAARTDVSVSRVTTLQAQLFQTFPSDFVFHGGLSAQYEQIGNAIPPLLAQALLSQFI